VTYITMYEFLLQELEVKMEINHLMDILEFVQDFNLQSNSGLYDNHAIFSEKPLEKGHHMLTWKSTLITSDHGVVYIERYKGSPLAALISVFKQSGVSKLSKN
jgi:hypothetical protein